MTEIKAPWQIANLPKNTPVLLALSGGADSRFLLHLLVQWQARDGFDLTLAHVHHGIRGEEADRDCEFCRQLATEYHLPIEILRADVPALAKEHGKGLEEEARNLRYAFFERVMRERKIPLLVTAHQANDQLETILLRICRGTTAKGMRGILPVRPFAGGYLVRPMLELSAEEIRTSCRELGLSYVEDSTNEDDCYSRNYVRKKILPALQVLSPEPWRQTAKLCASIREDDDYLSSVATEFLSGQPKNALPVSELTALHPAVLRRVLCTWVENQIQKSITSPHAEALVALLSKQASGASCPLPGNHLACIRRGRLCILPKPVEASPYETKLSEGTLSLPGGFLTVEKQDSPVKTAPEQFLLCADSLEGFQIRSQREGDCILRGGMHRKLRRELREAGVSPSERETLPRLVQNGGILWTPYVGSSDSAPKTGKQLYLLTYAKERES